MEKTRLEISDIPLKSMFLSILWPANQSPHWLCIHVTLAPCHFIQFKTEAIKSPSKCSVWKIFSYEKNTSQHNEGDGQKDYFLDLMKMIKINPARTKML